MEYRGFTKDVSKGGVYFYPQNPDRQLQVDQILDITIESYRQDLVVSYLPWINIVEARGKILRIDKAAGVRGQWGIAMQFLTTPRVM